MEIEKSKEFINWKNEILSFSSLKSFSDSPDHFISYKKKAFEPTDAMIAGQLVHALILEPDTVAERYVAYDGRRAGKVWEEFEAVAIHENKTVVKKGDFDAAQFTADNIRKNEYVQQMLDNMVAAEKSIEWTDDESGVKLRGFIDVLGKTWFTDFKSGNDTDPDKFVRNANDQKLSLQTALYFDGARANGYKVDEMFIVRFSMSPPYSVVIYQPTETFVQYGHAMKRRLLKKWNEWDGKPAGIEFHTGLKIQPLGIPRWAKPEPDMIVVDAINQNRGNHGK